MSLSDVFEERHYAPGYVYIAGSISDRMIKIGVTKNIHREGKYLKNKKYGRIADWTVLYYVWLDENAGDVEHQARRRLQSYKVFRTYMKDGRPQRARELVECSFSTALDALSRCISDDQKASAWQSRNARLYEFDDDETF